MEESEWLFRATMIFCRNFTTEQGWLVFIALVYILCAMLAAIILFKNNSYGAMLAFFSGFSTYAYGVNTMRHGMAAVYIVFGRKFWFSIRLVLRMKPKEVLSLMS